MNGAAADGRSKSVAFGPSDAELDDTNGKLRERARVQDLRGFSEEGRIIFEDIFGASVAAWESRSPAKMNSIRRLARRPGAPYGKDALTKRVAGHLLLQKLDFVWGCERISASHVVEVLRLSQEECEVLLRRVQAEAWSVRRLHGEVVARRRQRGERRGRRMSPLIRRAIVKLRSVVGAVRTLAPLLRVATRADVGSIGELRALSKELGAAHVFIQECVSELAEQIVCDVGHGGPVENGPSVVKADSGVFLAEAPVNANEQEPRRSVR